MSAFQETLFDLPMLSAFEGEFGFTPWAEAEAEPEIQLGDSKTSDGKPSTGSNEPDRSGLSPEVERRLRRKISNRESARRSRIKKQRHLEELRVEANRLRTVNRGVSARLGTVRHYSLLFRRDNERLRWESAALGRRLAEIRRIIMLRCLSQGASAAFPGEKHSGLGFAYLGLV